MPSRLQLARSEETRSGLVRTARRLFTEQGFAGTSTEQIVTEAGVTRGALYHHFDNKAALFEAVLIELHEEFVDTARNVADPAADAWSNLVAGCRAFLDSCLKPDVQRVALIDGPSALGPERWQEIEDRYALSMVRAGLDRAAADGTISNELDTTALARIVLAAVNEAGLYIAQHDEPTSARRTAGAAFESLLAGLQHD